VSVSVLLVWSENLLRYDLGATHPMAPGRLALTLALARELGILERPGVRVAAPGLAPDPVLELVHDPAYIAAVPVRCCHSSPGRSPGSG